MWSKTGRKEWRECGNIVLKRASQTLHYTFASSVAIQKESRSLSGGHEVDRLQGKGRAIVYKDQKISLFPRAPYEAECKLGAIAGGW